MRIAGFLGVKLIEMNKTVLEYLSGRVKFLEMQIEQNDKLIPSKRGGKTYSVSIQAMLVEAKMALSIAEGGKSILPTKKD